MSQTIDTICKKFCPVIYMHPNESYMPCSVPDLMRNSKFEFYSSRPPSSLLTSSPNDPMYTIENAVLRQADTKEKLEELIGTFTGLSYVGSPQRKFVILTKNIPNSVEIQAIFSDPFTMFKEVYFTITYLLFFPYNGTLEPHVFDQEYATYICKCRSFKFDNDSLLIERASIARVFLSSHGKGRWFDPDELQYAPDGRPIFYSALEGHALYPEPMSLRRFFGFGNDETVAGGIKYDAVNNVVVLAHPTSSLASQYYQLNKLYYFNGNYENQSSILFNPRRTNFLMYDGYYKTTNTSELWEMEPFKKFKRIFQTLFYVATLLILLILLDNNDFCTLVSYLCLIVFTIICTFLLMWIYVV